MTLSKLVLHRHCHDDDHRDHGDAYDHLELLLHLHQFLLHDLLLPLLRVGERTPGGHLHHGVRRYDDGGGRDDDDDGGDDNDTN